MYLASILQRGNLAAATSAPATTVATSSPVASPDKGTAFLNKFFGYDVVADLKAKTAAKALALPAPINPVDPSVMLNANRPAVDELPAPTMESPAASVPALQSIGQTLSPANFDWKKYLPWIVIALLVLFVLFSSKRKSA